MICTISRVPGIVTHIKQTKTKDCWTTVIAILISWLEQTIYTIDEIIDRLGLEYLKLYKDDTGLPTSKINDWLYVTDVVIESPQSYSQLKIQHMLKDFGPVVFTTAIDENNLHLMHARIIIGMQNIDGLNSYGKCTISNTDSTEIVGIDPTTGMDFILPFSVFCKELGYQSLDCKMYAQVIHLPIQRMFINNLKK